VTEKPLHVQVAEAISGTLAEPWYYAHAKGAMRGVCDGDATISGCSYQENHAAHCSWGLTVNLHGDSDTDEAAWFIAANKYPTLASVRLWDAPRYDTDWSATGPLIERYRIAVYPTVKLFGNPPLPGDNYIASVGTQNCGDFKFAAEANPLIAVCHLILALHKEGKLNP
jgi:hypothetical protein